MRLVLISDTHGLHAGLPALPDGDVLVHAGDVSNVGKVHQIDDFLAWFAAQPHRHKVFVAGNHDWAFEQQHALMVAHIPNDVHYLRDAGVWIDGRYFYGSPWQPEFCDWAFNLPRGPQLAARWDAIPDDTNVLVTHGPPMGILDEANWRRQVGCEDLRRRVAELPKLELHVFGHIHEAYGRVEHAGVTYVNASTCTREYYPTNPPIIIDLP